LKVLKPTYFVLFLLLSAGSLAQQPITSVGLWKLTNLNGDFNIYSFYRGNQRTFNQYYEFHQSAYISGGVNLKAKSFFWDPRFMTLDINAAFFPETGNELYINIPDRSEIRTLGKLDLRTILFKQNDLTINAFLNLNQSINNRENLTSLKANNKRWGTSLSYRNKVAPININYSQSLWNQEEIATQRVFQMDQKSFLTRVSKSFTERDVNEISYAHDNYFRRDGDLAPVENVVDNTFLKNSVYFDTKKKYSFRSLINDYNQRGSNEYRRFQANEQLLFKLPQRFTFIADYLFYNLKQPFQNLKQNRIRTSLKHQLYESLNTNVWFEYYKLNHTVYDEDNKRMGIDIVYSKKIPFKGHLNLTYRYFRQFQDMQSQDSYINVFNEELILSDGEITILNRPYIDITTVVVKDITGTIIYLRDFDYILIQRNDYVEIQRLPGGQIPNNQEVFVDYRALQPGSYQYIANNNTISANVRLFGHLVEMYYTKAMQDYPVLTNVEHITLNRFNQTIIGAKLDLDFISAGIEYNDYQSNIIPYTMMRYHLNLQKTFYKRLLCSLYGNVRNYEKTVDKIPQQFIDVTAKVIYRFKARTRISTEAGYRKQNGDGIDLELFTGKTEFETTYRQLTFKAGIDLYQRKNIGDDNLFYSVYGKLVRKFKL
jgi:hypothetical protein